MSRNSCRCATGVSTWHRTGLSMSGLPSYVGTELELFAQAQNWKAYFQTQLRPFIRGDVLEVGAGLGSTTAVLCLGSESSWTCLEPDAALAQTLAAAVEGLGKARQPPRVVVGTTATLAAGETFDTLLYIDVLE